MKTLFIALACVIGLLLLGIAAVDYASLEYRVRQLEVSQPCDCSQQGKCKCGPNCPCKPQPKPLLPRRRPDGKLGDVGDVVPE